MTQHRVFFPYSIKADTVVELPGEQAHYLMNVLRLKANDAVHLFDGHGYEFPCAVQKATRTTVTLRIGSGCKAVTESPLDSWLIQSIMRSERMDYCVQKATELGVRQIIPVFTQRTVVRLEGDRLRKRKHHWQKIALSACEQSGRVIPPVVRTPRRIDDLLDNSLPEIATLICMEPGAEKNPPESIAHTAGQPLLLFVGPEGGFDDHEKYALKERGAQPLTLGPRVLRSETAGIVGLTVCQLRWGDL